MNVLAISQITNFDSQYSGCVLSREPVSGGGSSGRADNPGTVSPTEAPQSRRDLVVQAGSREERSAGGGPATLARRFMNIHEGDTNIYEGKHPRASSAI